MSARAESGGASAERPAAAASWHRVRSPAAGPPRAIGGYAAGCIAGAVALPAAGRGYQVLRPDRRRVFGHPSLIAFVESLAGAARDAGLAPILVGDLSQPRGGHAPSGHASHQTGLDVDLWLRSAGSGAGGDRPLSAAALAKVSPSTVLDAKRARVDPRVVDRVSRLLALAATDARVARIFVHPAIKRDLCRSSSSDRAWLQKIRPWYGHEAHFHVRLDCPTDSAACEPQPDLPAGDGCGDDLAWWFSDAAKADRDTARDTYRSNVDRGQQYPEACAAVLAAPGAPR